MIFRRATAHEWDTCSTEAGLEILARGDAQALVVEIGALATFGGEHFVRNGIVDDARNQLALALQRNGNREMWDAVQEVGCTVERIDDEPVRFIRTIDQAGFLGEDGIAGARLLQFLDQNALGTLVSDADEIGGALQRDLQIFHFAEIANELAPRFARGGGHYVQAGER